MKKILCAICVLVAASVYSQDVYVKIQDSNNKNKILSKLNELIDESNNNTVGAGMII